MIKLVLVFLSTSLAIFMNDSGEPGLFTSRGCRRYGKTENGKW